MIFLEILIKARVILKENLLEGVISQFRLFKLNKKKQTLMINLILQILIKTYSKKKILLWVNFNCNN